MTRPKQLCCVNTGERFVSTREIVRLLVSRGVRNVGRHDVRAAIRDGRRIDGLLFVSSTQFSQLSALGGCFDPV